MFGAIDELSMVTVSKRETVDVEALRGFLDTLATIHELAASLALERLLEALLSLSDVVDGGEVAVKSDALYEALESTREALGLSTLNHQPTTPNTQENEED